MLLISGANNHGTGCFISLLESFPTEFSSENRRNDNQKLEQHHPLFFPTERLSVPKFEFRKFRKRLFVFDKQDISSADAIQFLF